MNISAKPFYPVNHFNYDLFEELIAKFEKDNRDILENEMELIDILKLSYMEFEQIDGPRFLYNRDFKNSLETIYE